MLSKELRRAAAELRCLNLLEHRVKIGLFLGNVQIPGHDTIFRQEGAEKINKD